MHGINKLARNNLPLLLSLAHVSTDGVMVAILKTCCPECFGNGRVNLPECLFTEPDLRQQLGRTWRHELQHARDLLDGVDLPVEQMEARARAAEWES